MGCRSTTMLSHRAEAVLGDPSINGAAHDASEGGAGRGLCHVSVPLCISSPPATAELQVILGGPSAPLDRFVVCARVLQRAIPFMPSRQRV